MTRLPRRPWFRSAPKRLSQRRSARLRATFETLEQRSLLAPLAGPNPPLTDVTPVWQFAWDRAADLTQYSPEEINTAAGWVLRLNDGASTASLPGATLPLDGLPNAYVWNPPADVMPGDVPALLATANSVQSYYPLVRRQQIARVMPNDPMIGQQWHLKNTGQTFGTPGEDANVEPVWTQGITGAGVTIAIVDDGLQWTHPDLSANYVAADSYDFNGSDSDPTPNSTHGHGTSAGGVAAARGNNALGVAGAAYNASLAGIRLIASATYDTLEASALSYHPQSIDIYSNSWGPYDDAQRLEGPGPATLAAFQSSVTTGRGGLGDIYVWAAGNGLQNNDNVNYDGYANSRYVIAVSAVGHNGSQSYYSEPGAPILVAAYSNDPGIVTTDLVGSNGYSSTDYANDFGGTSSATPLAAGVVALMLEANPNLTWRDVRQVLARSASKNSPFDSGWTVNAGGHDINHKYGFGAIDAAAAVALAKMWNTMSAETSYSSAVTSVNASIPDNNSTGVSSTINVPTNLRVDQVEVVFNASHSWRGDLEVVLTAPSGTQSVLAELHDDDGNNYSNWVFTSNRHLDELSAGNWTLTVRDRASSDTGTFQNWTLRLYGTPGDADYGDLPATYEVGSSARHGQMTALRLGGSKDTEAGPSAPLDATGDGADDNGVALPAVLNAGGGIYNYSVNVAGGTGKLSGWIDFNRDGDFSDAGEQVAGDTTVVAGDNLLSFTAPGGMSAGSTFARFRLSTVGGLAAGGAAADGEVEDYALVIDATPGGTLSASLEGSALVIADLGVTRSNHFTVSRSGNTLSVRDDNEQFISAPAGGSLSGDSRTLSFDLTATPLTSLTLHAAGGGDSLAVDLAGGDAIPDLGLQYNGGGGLNFLSVLGGAQGNVIYSYTSADDGAVLSTGLGWISFEDVATVSNTGSASSVLLQLPATATSATLGDDATIGNGIARLSGSGFTATDFRTPTGAFVLHGGTATALAVNSLGDFAGDVTLGVSAAPFSTLSVGAALMSPNKSLAIYVSSAASLSATTNLRVAGTGALQLSAESLSLAAGAKVQSAGGTIDLAADTVSLADGARINAGTGIAAIHPRTAGRGVNLGGADGADLGLTDAELDLVLAGTIRVGDSSAGPISATAALSRAIEAPATLELASGAAVKFPGAGQDLTNWELRVAAGTTVAFTVNGATPDSGYERLLTSGKLQLAGASLQLTGSYSPATTDVFTLATVTGTGPTGEFAGLPEGALVTVNGGANTMRITYVAGDGNDVALVPANATVGGFVWRDINGNGVFDPGEPTFAGAVVELLHSLSGVSQGIVLTGADGAFDFHVGPDNYRLEVRLPAGLSFTPPDQGANDLVDSDVNTTLGVTPSFAVVAGATDLSLAAGVIGAQPDFGWARGLDSGIGTAVITALDSAGNIISGTGKYGAFLLSKVTPEGAVIKTVSVGGFSSTVIVEDLAVSPAGDIFVIGTFNDSMSFPTPLTALGDTELFLARYTNDLQFVWSRRIGGTQISTTTSAYGTEIEIDADGNLLIAANFRGTIDADPGVGTDLLAAGDGTSTSNTETLILKLDPDGNRLWRNFYDGSGAQRLVVRDLKTAPNGRVIVAGAVYSNLDLDLGPGLVFLSGASAGAAAVLTLNSDGSFAWLAGGGGSSYGEISALAIGTDGAIYAAAGGAGSSYDIDPSPNGSQSANATSYVWKLNSSGGSVWTQTFNTVMFANGDINTRSAAVDAAGNLYLTGTYAGTSDFDPGPGTKNRTAPSSQDAFVLQLNPTGGFGNLTVFPHPTTFRKIVPAAVALDAAGKVYLSGWQEWGADFDPTTNVFQTVNHYGFAARLNVPINTEPTLTQYVGGGTSEDRASPPLSYTLDDFESGPDTLTISAASDNPTLLPPSSFVFSGSGANRTLVVTPALDQNGTAVVTVSVTDPNGAVGTNTFTFTVSPVNDPPSFVKGADQTAFVNAAPVTVSNWATAIAAGPTNENAQVVQFTIVNPSPTLFSDGPAVSSNGTLTFTPAPGAGGTVTITVRAVDNGGTVNGGVNTSPDQTFVISIVPSPGPPTISAIDDQTISEDDATAALSFTISDVGTPLDSLIVSASSNNSLLTPVGAITFAGSGADRTLIVTPAPDQFGTATIDVRVTDADGGSGLERFVLTVEAVNDAPSFTKGADRTVFYTQTTLQTITNWATAISTGPSNESAQTKTFVVVDNTNPGLFSTLPSVSSNGTLTFAKAAGGTGSATISLRLQDNGGADRDGVDLSPIQTFVIAVNPDSTSPTVIGAPADQTISEDGTTGALPFTVSDDVTATEELAIFVNSTDSNLVPIGNIVFGGTGADRTLTVTPAANRSGTTTITFRATDAAQNSTMITFVVQVLAVNDVPTFNTGSNQLVNEDTGLRTVSNWATSISAGPLESQTLAFSFLGNTNPALFAVPPAISGTGTLTYTLAANAFGSTTLSVVAVDNGGTANGGIDTSEVKTFTITVTNVNDQPSFTTSLTTLTTNEDAGPQSVPGAATAISAGPSNESGQTLTFSITSYVSVTGLFSVGPAIDPITGELTYTIAPNLSGSADVTVSLVDDGGTSNGGANTSTSRTFTIVVNPVNDAPTFVKGSNVVVNEDLSGYFTVWATAITEGASNETSQDFVFQVLNNTNPALFSVQPKVWDFGGFLEFTPAANAFGFAEITIVLVDNGGTANGGVDTSAPQTFTITVNAVNDRPSFTQGANQTVLEDAGPQSIPNWATAISVGPANESAQQRTFNVVATNPTYFSVLPAISPDGALTYTPAPNVSGTSSLTITLVDDGGTANGGQNTSTTSFRSITITAVNDAPVFIVGPNVTINEDAGAQSFTAWATGINSGPNESQSLTFSVTGNTNSALFSVQPVVNSSGRLTFTPVAGAFGTATITLTLSDTGGTSNGGVNVSAPQSFVITVNPINDPPSYTPGALTHTVAEDSGAFALPAWATALNVGSSFESAQTLSFHVVGNDAPALFAVAPSVAADGTLSFTPAENAFGTAKVRLVLLDDGGTANGGIDSTAETTLTINITPLNDPPTFVPGAPVIVDTIDGPQTLAPWANITAGPLEPGQPLTITVTGNTRPELFSVGPTLAADGTLTFTPAGVIGSADITVTIADNDGAGDIKSITRTFTIQIVHSVRVADFQVGGSGVGFVLTDPIVVAHLNLFASASRGPADLSLVGPSGPVSGSLIVRPGDTAFDFVATNGVLAPGSYMFTLRSAANGLVTSSGELLDGDGDYAAGGDFVRTFEVTAPPVGAVTVDLPNITRGPDQSIHIPAASTLGIPLSVSDGADLSSVSFELRFDAGLLNVTGVTLPASAPVDSTVQWSLPSTGVLTGTLTFGSPLAAGAQVVAYLQANVPLSAANRYGERALLDLTNVVLTNSTVQTVPVVEDDAVLTNVYFGDIGRNGRYDSFDVQQASRVALRLDSGFDLHPLSDPALVGDFNDNRRIDSFDVQRISRLALRLPVNEAPALPSPLPLTTNTGRFDDPPPVETPTKPQETAQSVAPVESVTEPVIVPRHNAVEGRRADINNDGGIDSQDVLFAVYYYSRSPNGSLPAADDSPQLLLDVTNDGLLDPQDILTAIVDLNARTLSGNEGEATLPAATDEEDSLAELLALDLIAEREKKAKSSVAP